MSRFKIFSFFTGAGLLDLGFEMTGFDIIAVNETEKKFLDIYTYAREKMSIPLPEYIFKSDITDFRSPQKREELRGLIEKNKRKNTLIGFIGGPPCVDFSQAGLKRGEAGKTGGLVKTYFELIDDFKPDFFLFENVPYLRTKKHLGYYEACKGIVSDGYGLTEKVVDCLAYGVPQTRKRLFLFGVTKNCGTDEIDTFEWYKHAKFNPGQVLNLPWPKTRPFDEVLEIPQGVPLKVTVQHWFIRNNVRSHPNQGMQFKPRKGLKRILTTEEGDVSNRCYKRLHRYRYSPTAAYGNNEVHIHPFQHRRLSVAEVMAIQSLPPTFVIPEHMSLSKSFKALANGVPYLAAREIARTIKEFLSKNNKSEN